MAPLETCRTRDDREYIDSLASLHSKVRIRRLEGADGTNRSVNRFYSLCRDDDTFYIKLDDDIVYLPASFGASLCGQAAQERDKYIWWSPLVINNAICSWLIKQHSRIEITEWLSCQAGDPCGWSDPGFAERLHRKFIFAIQSDSTQDFQVPLSEVSLSRFSINCLGFFGTDVKSLGQRFCPPDVDDEEWLSACLPSLLNRPGRVIGNLIVAHFSFFPQEAELLRTKVLDLYYNVAGLSAPHYVVTSRPLRQRLFLAVRPFKKALFGV